MNQHFLSAAYPAMSAEEFQSLKDSIEVIGVQTPVTLFEGDILDGWHRWTATLELSMACPTVELGDVDPRDFVRAVNGKSRRHLSQSQLAAAEVKLWAWAPVGKPNSAIVAELATTAQMAAAAGVSKRTIEDAKTVESKASPEVKAAVRAGTMPVSKAAATTRPAKPAEAATEPKPEADAVEYQIAEYKRVAAEATAAMNEALDSNTVMAQAFDADDRTAALFEENTQLRAQVKQLRVSMNGHINENNVLKATVKSLQAKLKKLEATA